MFQRYFVLYASGLGSILSHCVTTGQPLYILLPVVAVVLRSAPCPSVAIHQSQEPSIFSGFIHAVGVFLRSRFIDHQSHSTTNEESSFMDHFKQYRLGFESIRRATKEFHKDNCIGEGGFGMVYRGEFVDSKGMTLGAVKRFHPSVDGNRVSFGIEVKMLAQYRHKNLISLIGFCDEGEEMIIVYEYAHNQSLDYHLIGPKLTWTQRLKICLGAARGLEYLHDPKGTQQRVLHRDIKSANILLDENWNAKVADFGLSKLGPANQELTFLFSDPKGTPGYCDPMYAETMFLTKESDVYSFGVVLFEVLCSRHCADYRYKDERRSLPRLVQKCCQENKLDTIIDANLYQQMDHNSYDTFVTLACECLERDRTKRPLMASVVERLQTALQYQEVFEGKAQEPESSLKSKKLREIYNPLMDFEKICPPGGSDSVVLYTTAVKTIPHPKMFEDCVSIRCLLKGFKVSYEERDVSVHWAFKEELCRIMGRRVAPPRLFIKGRYIGGADEVSELHEQGKFWPLLAGMPQIISEGSLTKQ